MQLNHKQIKGPKIEWKKNKFMSSKNTEIVKMLSKNAKEVLTMFLDITYLLQHNLKYIAIILVIPDRWNEMIINSLNNS